MKRLSRSIILLLFVAQVTQAAVDFEEVAPGLFVHIGKIVDLFETDRGPVSNITFVVGEHAVAVIDTGGSRRAGEAILAAIRDITPLPIKYVINTHVHADHNFGNQAFLSEEPAFIAHHLYPGDFAAKSHYFRQRLTKPWFEGTTPVAATQTVDQETELNLGNRPLVLTPHPRAHTRHDLTVLDKKTNTLIAGDLLFVEHLPTLDGSLLGWLAVMETLRTQPFDLIVPGHGPVQGSKEGLEKQTRYLTSLAQAVRAAIKDNIDINTASTSVLSTPLDDWKLYSTYHPRNVIQAYKELEWE